MLLRQAAFHAPWREVEDGMRRCAHPLAEITSIRERHSACDDTGLELCLCRHIARTRDDDFVCGPDLAPDELDFVRDQETDRLYILALAPSPREDVPLDVQSINHSHKERYYIRTWVGVQTITSPFSSSLKSALVSPVKLTISFPPCKLPNLLRHSTTRRSTISW